MQQALRNQALASGSNKILFINLKDEPKRTLYGQPSQASLSAFWKSIKIQKVKTIEQLLERWDFDGANQIIKGWKEALEFLADNGINEVSNLLTVLIRIGSGLEMGVAFLNLDNTTANRLSGQVPDLNRVTNSYDVSLNIYTQCRIFEELNQYANLLLRLSTFIESCQVKIIKRLGQSYFSNCDNLELDVNKIDEKLRQNFCKIESQNNKQFREADFRGRYKLRSRFSIRNFIQAIIDTGSIETKINYWSQIQDAIDSLEFWVEIRNNLAHGGQGVSLATMNTELESKKRDGHNNATKACPPNKIINQMAEVYNLAGDLLHQSKSTFTNPDSKFYIYSEIRDWVLNELYKL